MNLNLRTRMLVCDIFLVFIVNNRRGVGGAAGALDVLGLTQACPPPPHHGCVMDFLRPHSIMKC